MTAIPKTTEEIPITITETSLCKVDNIPIANSHPHAIDTTINSKFQTFLKAQNSKITIRTIANEIARRLSVFICCALPTAIAGPPVK